MTSFAKSYKGEHGELIARDDNLCLHLYKRLEPGTYKLFSLLEYIGNFHERSTTITKVIYNNPATIVFWSDGSKTVVKRGVNDIYDPEKGLAMAVAKKALGNVGNYYNLFKKWLPEDYNAPVDHKPEPTKTSCDFGTDLRSMVEDILSSFGFKSNGD